ncbi:diguanylate cyclase (GGDEF) domain-containing protein [Pseudobutyrivibrio sp. C4]|uniref:GGDEF domain-containing protein n=1 Tax=Pseudobutyrivibrio sp. C4 TaxID=1520803 RepID=UPI0008D1A298|nr:diguanylate cyclase [Pseudobutyrivibrio sp. C4]SET40011.1 diguanylate cyclase (GGDEF) domain-containing protein [Pseudobutyrivibrio sp. C4]
MLNSQKLYNDLFYMGVSKEEFNQVKDVVFEDNRRTVGAGSMCAIQFCVMSLLMSLRASAYNACRLVFIVSLILSIAIFITSQTIARKNKRVIKLLVATFSFMVLMAGIAIAYFQPDVRTATMIAFTIIVPTLVIKNTFTDCVMETIAIIVYAILCRNVIEPEIYSWGFTNLIIFAIAGILMSHVISKERCAGFVYAESKKELANIQMKYAYYDQLTDLKNRRAFEEDLQKIEAQQVEFSLAMLDLNGLKQANDTLGHDAGDELIVAAAQCLKKAFEGNEYIYRFGGDEFCVIHIGTANEAAESLNTLDELTANWKGNLVNGFTISHGVASRNGHKDISTIIKIADEKMYESKRDYYKRCV